MSQLAQPPPPPKWVLDLNSPSISKPKNGSTLPDPPGFTPSNAITKKEKGGNGSTVAKQRKLPSGDEMDILKMKKAWEVAIQPAKNLPMSAIGMYMSGNSLQIFTIFMLFQCFKAPISGLLGLQAQFARFESDGARHRLWMTKLVYILCNLLGFALGIWKINQMGLLP